MSSELGKQLKVSVFGESHGKAIGVNIDGLPAGEEIDFTALQRFLDRRKPGQNAFSTFRKEGDKPIFLSGMNGTRTNGFPLCAIIENHDQHSSDYEKMQSIPRPGHADYTAFLKYGQYRDMAGGGHFSGRLTAPLCIAGGIAIQILQRKGIFFASHIKRIGQTEDDDFGDFPKESTLKALVQEDFPLLNLGKREEMQNEILQAKNELDSVGGIIEGAITGLPGGLGGPLFDGMEGKLSLALFGIPGVKGVEFGNGFSCAQLRGSENNDAYSIDKQGQVSFRTNRCGGLLGGITTSAPLIFRVAIKPTPSIGQQQNSVDLKENVNCPLQIKGRHDPCIVPRALPVVESVCACVILDSLL